MKPLFWIGIVLVVLGLVSLVVPISRTQRDGINAGGMSMTVETQHSEKAPAMVSIVLILAGAGMVFAGRSAVQR